MKNCIVAQSGGPTSVINASVIGLFEKNLKENFFDKVYGGINGIEGVLKEELVNLNEVSKSDIDLFLHTPSAGLGSCRYKLSPYEKDDTDYKRLFEVFEKYQIKTFFYIGGNDSQDTIYKLSEYAKLNNLTETNFIGIPKTVDNDLMEIDHTPGFGSAARYISTSVLESYLDSLVYSENGIFITETMGRDTGWLAGSACLARYNGKQCADIILLPEVPFNEERFLDKVRKIYNDKKHVYIVISEGTRTKDGEFLSSTKAHSHDSFGHTQLGGAGNALKNIVVDAGITQRVKVLELSVLQRSAFHLASKVDHKEAYALGENALNLARDEENGVVSVLKRKSNSPYEVNYTKAPAANIANKVKYMPKNYISEDGFDVTKEAYEYFYPLVDKLPEYRVFHNYHNKND